jgi:hypothetical protein
MVLAGRAYSATSSSVAPGTSFGTTPPFALYNPIGSGVNLVIWKVSIGYVSGTLGAGYIGLSANTNTAAAAPTGGTVVSITHNFLGNVMGFAPKGQPQTGCTLPVAPTVLRPLWTINAMLATTATQPEVEDIDIGGEYVVAPGATISFGALAAAGSTPLLQFGFSWAEIPLA